MKKAILLSTFVLLVTGACAQKELLHGMPVWVQIAKPDIRDSFGFGPENFKSLDFDSIGVWAADGKTYEALAARFENGDTTLNYTQLATLYYGMAFRPNYTGFYGDRIPDRKRTARLKAGYRMCMQKLAEYPASPYFLNCAVQIAERMGKGGVQTERLWWRLYGMLSVILTSGNGTMEAPFVVLDIMDEYETVWKMLGVVGVKRMFFYGDNHKGRTIEYLEVETGESSSFEGSEVWFDVDFPFRRLCRRLGTAPADSIRRQ